VCPLQRRKKKEGRFVVGGKLSGTGWGRQAQLKGEVKTNRNIRVFEG